MFSADTVTPVTQAVTVAVAGGVFGIISLLISNHNKSTQDARVAESAEAAEERRLKEKREDIEAAIDKEARDYARQDLVSARLADATRVTLQKLTDVEDLGKVTHALVNSDKTAAMKERRDGLEATLTLMKEVMSLKLAQNIPASQEAINAVVEMQQRIVTLDADIADRLAQQEAAEKAAGMIPMSIDTASITVANLTDLSALPPPQPPAKEQ